MIRLEILRQNQVLWNFINSLMGHYSTVSIKKIDDIHCNLINWLFTVVYRFNIKLLWCKIIFSASNMLINCTWYMSFHSTFATRDCYRNSKSRIWRWSHQIIEKSMLNGIVSTKVYITIIIVYVNRSEYVHWLAEMYIVCNHIDASIYSHII